MDNDRFLINPFKENDKINILDYKDALEKSFEQYYTVCNQCDLLDNNSQGRLVSNIALNLIESIESYLLKIDRIDYIEDYFEWDFHLIESSYLNAFCMAGGKIAIFSAVSSIADSEEKVAFLLAHEIAHTLLNHPRIQIIVKDKKYNSVPCFRHFSSEEEFEADKLGMAICHWVGYDIGKIPSFWEEMFKSHPNRFNFLATHPLDDERLRNMKSLVSKIKNQKEFYPYPIIAESDYEDLNEYLRKKYSKPYKEVHRSNKKIMCRNCGCLEDLDSEFCSNCGSRLFGNLVCGRCGSRIDKNDLFCSNCGLSLVDDLKCPVCGNKISPGDVFCINCGKKL